MAAKSLVHAASPAPWPDAEHRRDPQRVGHYSQAWHTQANRGQTQDILCKHGG
jgi:hypothetical protein